MRIEREHTAALIVDFQERLVPAIADHEALMERVRILLQGLKVLEIPMTVTQQYTKGLGMSVPEVWEASGETEYLDKISFSALEVAEPKIHDKKYNCPKKPVRQRQDNRQSKFRSTYKWTKKAQAVKRRDGYLCQVCLRGLYHPERQYETEGLEVHHIQTVASCYEKRLDGYNLLTLCKRHHKMADAGKIPAKELQMIAAEQEEK